MAVPEEIREDEVKSVSLVSKKKRSVYTRVLRSHPDIVTALGSIGLFDSRAELQMRAPEEVTRLEMGEVVVPLFGFPTLAIGDGNPSYTSIPRRGLGEMKFKKQGKKKKKGGKE